MSRKLQHPFDPIYDEHSEILILGSFPSPNSRGDGFYYGDKGNRFWSVLSEICDSPSPTTKDEKTRLLLENRIALWDIVGECDYFEGAADNDIKNPMFNDICGIIVKSKIRRVICNGKKTYDLFEAYKKEKGLDIETARLNSTSAANCRNCSYDMLLAEWKRSIRGVETR